MSFIERSIEIPSEYIQMVFGQFDRNIKKIQKTFSIDYVLRGDVLTLSGDEPNVEKALSTIEELAALLEKGNPLTEQAVDYTLSLGFEEKTKKTHVSELEKDVICHTVSGKPVKAKTFGQKEYVEAIDKNMIVFGTGPAGTGKTYLAMAKAITAFKRNEVGRIILTRPAIEAGEKLGFLPGDLQSKVDPYLRPLYDALYEIMGADQFQKNMEKGLIEVAPLAYMRGRTLDNAFIVLDEAQNTTPAQMKMFLTRIGFGSKAIITGDASQKDLAYGAISGLDTALKVVSGIEGIAVCKMTSLDVVRHPLVQKIVDAYEKYDAKHPAEPDKSQRSRYNTSRNSNYKKN